MLFVFLEAFGILLLGKKVQATNNLQLTITPLPLSAPILDLSSISSSTVDLKLETPNHLKYYSALILPSGKGNIQFSFFSIPAQLQSLEFYSAPTCTAQDLIFSISRPLDQIYTWNEYIPSDTIWIQFLLSAPFSEKELISVKFEFSPLATATLNKKRKQVFLPSNNDVNFTCDKAVCLVRGQQYSNRLRPICTPCNGVWRPPISVCGNGIWSSMDNPVFYKFEVLPSTPQPVSITLVVSECEGGNSALQLGIWGFPDCPGGGQLRFETCNAGVGSVNVSKILPIGQYFLVADGSAGSICDWVFESNVNIGISSNSPAYANPSQQICEGQTLQFFSSQVAPGSTYSWQGPQGFSSTQSAPTIPNVTTHYSGTYSVTINPPPGTLCPEVVQLSTQVFIKPLPVLSIPSSRALCEGQTLNVTQTSQGGVSYFWQGPNNFNQNGNILTINNITAAQRGTYTLTGILNGCTTTATTQVIVHSNPAPPTTGNAILARCGAGPFTFTALVSSPTNMVIRLYDSPTSNTILQAAQAPPYVFTINYISTTTTFYLESFNTATGCISNRNPVTITVHPALDPPTATSVQRCSTGIVTFTVFPPPGTSGNLTVRMYSLASSGNVITTTSVSPYQLSATISTTTTFYFDIINNQTGCTSISRASALAEVVSPPPPPTLDRSNYEVCGNTSITILPSLPPTNNSIQLKAYTSLIGTQSIWESEGPNYVFNTPIITTHTTYYLESEIKALNCKSTSRVAVPIRYIQAPTPLPNVSVSRCGSGSISFSVSVTDPEVTQVLLYTSPSATNPISTLTAPNWSYSLINLTTTTTYYLQTSKAASNCSSPSRSTATLMIFPIPALPPEQNIRICSAGNVSFSIGNIENANSIRLYTSATATQAISTFNGPPFSITLSNITTHSIYFLESYHTAHQCSSSKTRVSIHIVSSPEDFTVANVSRCGNGIVTFTVTLFQGGNYTVNLHSTQGGPPIAQANFFPYLLTPPSLTTTTTFYIQLLDNSTSCSSSFRQVVATIHPTPSNPTTSSIRSCTAGKFTFTVNTGIVPANQVALYTTSNATVPYTTANGSPFRVVTPWVETTTTFWLEAINTNTSCQSERVPTRVEIFSPPTLPTLPTISICRSEAVTVSYTFLGTASQKLDFYTQAPGGNFIGSAVAPHYSFTFPRITTSTTFYVEVVDIANQCTSTSRAEQSIVLVSLPELPQEMNLQRCGQGTVTFTISLARNGNYTAALFRQFSGNEAPIAQDNFPPYELSTPFLATSTDFFFAWIDRQSQCTTDRVKFSAIILPSPTSLTPQALSRCGDGSVTFSFNWPAPPNHQLLIFRDELLTQVITHIPTPPWVWNTPTITTTSRFYVIAQNLQTLCNSAPAELRVNIITPVTSLQPQRQARCGSGRIQFRWPNIDPTIQSVFIYENEFSATFLAELKTQPFSWETPFITTTTTYYVSAVNSTGQCTTARTTLEAIIYPNPASPPSPILESCGPTSFTLSVNLPSLNATEIRLYSQPSSNSSISTSLNNVLTTPVVTQNTDFFLEAYNATTNCTSSRSILKTIIKDKPRAPVFNSVYRCGAGITTFTLLSNNLANDTIKLYTLASGQPPIATRFIAPYELTTPFLTTTTTFYVALASRNGCESERTEIVANIMPLPPAPRVENARRCGAGKVSFSFLPNTPTSLNYLLLKDIESQEILATTTAPFYQFSIPWVSTTTTFYVVAISENSCSSTFVPSVVQIIEPPAPITIEPTSICKPQSIKISYTLPLPPGSIISLYSEEEATLPFFFSHSLPFEYITPIITTHTTYYVSVTDVQTGCESSREEIIITLLHSKVYNWSKPQRCGAGPLAFELTNIDAGNEVRLYSPDQQLLSTAFFPPYRFLIPQVTTSSTFFVEVYTPATRCSSDRIPFPVEILPLPGMPISRNEKRCGSGTLTFLVVPSLPFANEFRLYSDRNAPLPIAYDNIAPYQLTTPLVTTTTTFFIESFDSHTGCKSERYPLIAEVIPLPESPQTASVLRCGVGPITFTISVQQTEGNIRLYTSATTTSPLQTVELPQNTITISAINSSQTFYIELEDKNTLCLSPRSEAQVRFLPPPAPPIIQNTVLCGQESVTFTITASDPAGNQIRMYDAVQDGNLLTFTETIPFLLTYSNLQTHTYLYIESYNTVAKCSSSRVQVIAYKKPGVPLLNPLRQCEGGNFVILPGFTPPQGTGFRLYSSITSTVPLDSTTLPPYAITLPNITTTSTFFLSTIDATTGCESEKLAFVLEVLPLPPPPLVTPLKTCARGSFTFTIAYANNHYLKLYENFNDLVPIVTTTQAPYQLQTPVISTSTTFYIEAQHKETGCKSQRIPLVVELLPPLPEPHISKEISRCGSGVIILSPTMENAEATAIYLYDSPLENAIPIARSSTVPYTLETPFLTTHATFYLQAINQNTGCVSTKKEINLRILTPPGQPITSNVTRCGPGKITFTLIPTPPFASHLELLDLNYNIIASTQLPNTTLTIDPVITTTDFWVRTTDIVTGCKSSRAGVTAYILPPLEPPLVEDIKICGAGRVTFSILRASQEVTIYENEYSSIPIANLLQAPFTFEAHVTTNTIFYFENVTSTPSCTSNRSTARVIVYPIPELPNMPSVSICQFSAATLTISLPPEVPIDRISLYSASQGGSPLATSTNERPFKLTTPIITQNTIFYLEGHNTQTGCTSARVVQFLQVFSLPGAPRVRNWERCGVGSITFIFGLTPPFGSQVEIYNSERAGELVGFSATPPFAIASPFLETSTTFYAQVRDTQTGCVSQRRAFRVEILPGPPPPIVIDEYRCGQGIITFSINTSADMEVRIYTTASSLSPIYVSRQPNATFVTPYLSTTTTFYFENYHATSQCNSERKSVIAYIYPLPGTPILPVRSICANTFSQFTVLMGVPPGDEIRLYTQNQGGLPIAIDNNAPYLFSFNNSISSTTTFYLEVNNSLMGCTSPRVPFTIFLPPGEAIASPVARCGAGAVMILPTLTSPLADKVALYNSTLGGELLAESWVAPYALFLPNVTQTTTFYLEAIDTQTGCRSARSAVLVDILALPSAPRATSLARCTSGNFIFTIQDPAPNFTYYLYTGNNEEQFYSQTSQPPYTLHSPYIATTTTFYFQAKNNLTGCLSSKAIAKAEILQKLLPPYIPYSTVCAKEGVLEWQVFLPPSQANQVAVYDLPVGGMLLAKDSIAPYTFQLPAPTHPKWLYLEAQNTRWGCTSERIPLWVAPSPFPPSVSTYATCPNQTLVIELPSAGENVHIALLDQAVGGTILSLTQGSRPSFTFSGLLSTTTYFLQTIDPFTACSSQVQPLVINVVPPPPPPILPQLQVCKNHVLTIQPQITLPGLRLLVYADPLASIPLYQSSQFPYTLRVNAPPQNVIWYAQYQDTLVNCFSARVPLEIQVLSLPQITSLPSIISVCEGESLFLKADSIKQATYLWILPNGEYITSPNYELNIPYVGPNFEGEWRVFAIVSNCTSSAHIMQVTVIPSLPTPTLPNSQLAVCQGQFLELNISNLLAFPTATEFFWETQEGNYLGRGPTWHWQAATTPGEWKIRVVAFHRKCQAQSSWITITVHPQPQLPKIINPSPTCESNSFITLTVDSVLQGYQYFWQGPLESSLAHLRIPAHRTFAGVYSLVVISEKGCTSAQQTTTVVFSSTPVQPQIRGNTQICEGTILNLEVVSPIEGVFYEWRLPSNSTFFTPTLRLSNVQTNVSGIYTLTALQGNCRSFPLEIPVQIVAVPKIISLSTPFQVCAGEQLILKAEVTTASGIFWETPGRGILRGNEIIIPSVASIDSGNYVVWATLGNCTSNKHTRFVQVLQKPRLQLNTNAPICEGQTLRISANSSLQSMSLWEWQGPNGTWITNSAEFQITNVQTLHQGIYRVRQRAGICSATAEIFATVLPKPIVSTLPQIQACWGQTLQLQAQSTSSAQFFWQGPVNFRAYEATAWLFNVDFSQRGIYSVYAIVQGCTSEVATTEVQIAQAQLILPYTTFYGCAQSSITVPFQIEGNFFPYILRYRRQGTSFEYECKKAQDTLSFTIVENEIITLEYLVDSKDCLSPLNKTITLQMRSLPSASFDGNELYFCNPAQAYLPFYLKGISPWLIRYKVNGVLQPPLQVVTNFSSSTWQPILLNVPIPNAQAGVYELVEVQDATGCKARAAGSFILKFRSNERYNLEIDSLVIGCEGQNVLQVRAKVSPPTEEAFWLTPQNQKMNVSNLVFAPFTKADTGTYTFYGIVRGCTVATGKSRVQVRSRPPLIDVASKIEICENQNLILGLRPFDNNTYYWRGPGDFFHQGDTLRIGSTTTNNAGIYSVQRIQAGCTSAVSQFELRVLPLPEASLDSVLLVFCEDSQIRVPISFKGTAPFAITYRINGVRPVRASGFLTSPYYLELPPLGPGSYLFTIEQVEDASTCRTGRVRGQTLIQVREPLRIQEVEKISPICQKGYLQVKAIGGGGENYSYKLSSYNFEQQNLSGRFENLEPQLYSLTVSNGSCTKIFSIDLTVRQPILTHIFQDTANQGLQIFWNPVAGAIRYELRYRKVNDNEWNVITGITQTQLLITQLLASTNYEFSVRAICSNGLYSDWSLIRTATSPRLTNYCGPPVDSFIKITSAESATVHWQNLPNTICTILEYGLVEQDPNSWAIALVPSPGKNFTLSNLEPNKKYGIRLKSNCSACSARLGYFSTPIYIEFIPSHNLRMNLYDKNCFLLYPNPAREKIILFWNSTELYNSSNSNEGIMIKIVSASGVEILRKLIKEVNSDSFWEEEVDIRTIPSGVYEVVVQDKGLGYKIFSTKLVIVN
ncbi:MAG: fibronectin type III domain-containing protein [Bacteroidia bacterium]|nr:fibronectin type III domain-containing protein [Bacteroidia bacterium]